MSAATQVALHRVAAGGSGEPVVLVHGSWSDHTTWIAVQPLLAAGHRTVAYDRRGHSRSGPADGLGSRRVHEDDLVALIVELGLGPVHLVGNSFGGSLALGVAARRPDLVRSVAAHEPPLVDVAREDPALTAVLAPVLDVAADVERMLRSGDAAGAARRFVEDAVLGPGAWAMLPPPLRDAMVANGPTFLEMVDGGAWGAVPQVPPSVPVLLTTGSDSPGWLPALTQAVAARHPHAVTHVFHGAGHVPQATHPDRFAASVATWVAVHAQVVTEGRR